MKLFGSTDMPMPNHAWGGREGRRGRGALKQPTALTSEEGDPAAAEVKSGLLSLDAALRRLAGYAVFVSVKPAVV